MPNNTFKSAAVPFVNQKGERSMKRVKVERYVAGKKPTYAKDEDEDEEYYTTDEEGASEEEISDREDQSSEQEADAKSENNNGDQANEVNDDDDDDDDDDPRFRRLKQIESKIEPKSTIGQIGNIGFEDEEDEEEIKRRHALARQRRIEEPIGLGPQQLDSDVNRSDVCDLNESHVLPKRIETDDFLKDFKLKIEPLKEQEKVDEESDTEDVENTTFTSQLHKRIEEDIKREREKEALVKGDIGARDMSLVNTDDEDEELAYEEWKLREIKRVLRDRAEHAKVKRTNSSQRQTRAKFEDLNIELFKSTLKRVRKVLKDVGSKKKQLHEIVVIDGGSARIFRIKHLVGDLSGGKKPTSGINPDEAVAYSAPIQAGALSGQDNTSEIVLLDVNPLMALGVESIDDVMTKLINRNSYSNKKVRNFHHGE